ncbi:hypothetical protein BJY24_004114 [Nocardia transvalensis]|uniref:Uncharacterized protein n=1 Tax=Nocardia transvalensis TaxID=37333 RepID=A0A7W9PFL2_9NOCA|nr:hypothetical protein [Nocardia transvalensis]
MITPSPTPLNHTSAVDHIPTPATDSADTQAVRWPDPSPLDHWWTEVMDGALTPTRPA